MSIAIPASPRASRPASPTRAAAARTARAAKPVRRQPLLWWALVMMVAMMSFYVHLLNGQVQRAEGLRQAQRSGAAEKVTVATKAPSRTLRMTPGTGR